MPARARVGPLAAASSAAGAVGGALWRNRQVVGDFVNQVAKGVKRMRNQSKNTENKKRKSNAKAAKGGSARESATGAERTEVSFVWGKSRRLKMDKFERASANYTRLRWQAVCPFQNTATPCAWWAGTQPTSGQALYLPNYSGVTAGAGLTYLPLHLYDLTSTYNSTSSGLISASPGYQACLRYVAGSIAGASMQLLSGTDPQPAGPVVTTLMPWRLETTPGSGGGADSSTYPGARCIMTSVNIRLNCQGPVNYPTRWTIQLVQFKEEFVDPSFVQAGAITSGTIATQNWSTDAAAFYQALVCKEASHPLQVNNNGLVRKYMRVLKSYSFMLQEKMTFENGPNVGHCRLVKIRWNPNRICKYDWDQHTVAVEPQADSYPVNINANSAYTSPKSRVYLLVKATALQQSSGTTVMTPSTYPSYDIIIGKTQLTVR